MVVVILYTKYVYVRWIGFILRDLVTPRYFTRGHQSQIGHGTARALHAPRVSRCCLPLPLSPPPSPLLRAAPRVGHPRRQRRRRLVMYLPRPYLAQRPLLPLPFFFLEQSSNELEQLAFRRPNPWPPLHQLQITRTRSSLTSLAPSPAPWN